MKSLENEAAKIAAELSVMLGLSWGDHKWDIPRAVSEEAWFAVRVKQEELLGLDKGVDYEQEGSVQGNTRVKEMSL